MGFVDRQSDAVAVVDGQGRSLTFRQLAETADTTAREYSAVRERPLVLLAANNSIDSLVAFVACLEYDIPVILVSGDSLEAVSDLTSRYRPDIVVTPNEVSLPGYGMRRPGIAVATTPGPMLHDELAVLLTTSGSTGSPKLVRLSANNVRSNADDIIETLGISTEDRGFTTLPLFYSYGMSVVTSHLRAGASLVLSSMSVLDREMWRLLSDARATSFAGVPYTFQLIERLRLLREPPPTLRKVTQAGGRLDIETQNRVHDALARVGAEFFVMYGQTEASPRMACLPSQQHRLKIGSVGPAMPHGTFWIVGEDGAELPRGQTGEVVYDGPNVMLGYAETASDLALPDVMNGRLATGDLGYLDGDGYLYLTGRAKRIAKVYGLRLSLDDVEAHVRGLGFVAAAVEFDGTLHVYAEPAPSADSASLRRELAAWLKVPPAAVRVSEVSELPLLDSGKIDYRKLSSGGEQ